MPITDRACRSAPVRWVVERGALRQAVVVPRSFTLKSLTMTGWIISYLVCSAIVAAAQAADHREGKDRLLFILLLVALWPVLVIGSLAVDAWEWLESHAQAKTFWYFLFNRKRMIRTKKELDRMHRITLAHRSTGSLHHRLWRLAERCYFIVNDYRPPVS